MTPFAWLFGASLLGGIFLLLALSPVRLAAMDGFRCLTRYQIIWQIPVLFALGYNLFQLVVRVAAYCMLPEGEGPVFAWDLPWMLSSGEEGRVFRGALLSSLEGVAGIFNAAVATYPVSAVAAVYLLLNWEGHRRVLADAVLERFGGWGWCINGSLLACAVAAVLKPAFFALLPWFGRGEHAFVWYQAALVADWMSFVFEYLFGVCIQLYMILHVYVWVRGLHFTHRHLLDFAIRRFSIVGKWAGIVVLASSLLIHVPMIVSGLFWDVGSGVHEAVFAYIDRLARPLLAVGLLCFFGVQIVLTFHTESLGDAVRDHFRFVRDNLFYIGWLLLLAFACFYSVQVLNELLVRGKGEGTGLVILWQLLFPFLFGGLIAWMLATWVCLYKRCEAGRREAADWIRF